MGRKSCESRIVVRKVIRKGIRYAGFAPILLFTCSAGFAQVPCSTCYSVIVAAPNNLAPPPPPSPHVTHNVALAAPAPGTGGNGSTGSGNNGNTAPTPVTTAQAPKPLDGLGFGAGVALSFGQSRVNSAVAVGPTNIVRVTDGSGAMAGIVFETHYFFVPPASFLLGSALPITWGYGPFIAVDASTSASSNSAVIAGVSLGWMVGFRKMLAPAPTASGAPAVADNNSWNFGIGLRVDPKATVLGDGITANMPLPAGESSPVRLKSVSRYGVMFLTSYGF
jgi:hypothetical protein